MLVLTRRPGQAIKVGDCLTIVVVSTSKCKVKLAIEAPRNITVLRDELLREELVTEAEKTIEISAL